MDVENLNDTIERVSIDKITVEEFIYKYERGSRPVILTGVAKEWPAWQEWKVSVSNFCYFMSNFVETA